MLPEGSPVRRFSPPHLLELARLAFRPAVEITADPETPSVLRNDENQRRMREAERVLGQDFLGPGAIEQAFGISLTPQEIPQLDISPAVLSWAKGEGLMLVLRIDRSADGSPLTIERLEEMLRDEFAATNAGRVLDRNSFYPKQNFFTQSAPRAGWFLVSKDTTSGTDSKNYLDQGHKMGEFMIDSQTIIGKQVPLEAAHYLSGQDREFQALLKDNPEQAVAFLSYFSLNQDVRQTPVEAVYDLLLYFQKNGIRLLPKKTTLTGGANSFRRDLRHFIEGNRFIGIGLFDSGGIKITEHKGNSADAKIGASIAFPVPKPTFAPER